MVMSPLGAMWTPQSGPDSMAVKALVDCLYFEKLVISLVARGQGGNNSEVRNMAITHTPKIYLAGPISGCNERQQKEWRQQIKALAAGAFDFICPVENLENSSCKTPFQVVKLDQESIADADLVIANMWKESIGTAIGISTAASKGKPVIIIDRNCIDSSTLAYYAYAIRRNESEALSEAADYFKYKNRIESVRKSDGSLENFNPTKIAKSIRMACVSANQNEMIAASEMMPKVIRKLFNMYDDASGTVSSGDIREAVFQVLDDLQKDPEKREYFQNIKEEWIKFRSTQMSSRKVREFPIFAPIHPKPQSINMRIPKETHATIWGKIRGKSPDDLPLSAKKLIEEIFRVDGIIEFVFTDKTGTKYKKNTAVEFFQDPEESWIMGSILDNADYGAIQHFRIKVKKAKLRNSVLNTLRKHLLEMGYYRKKN